jgi:hypothetical protein
MRADPPDRKQGRVWRFRLAAPGAAVKRRGGMSGVEKLDEDDVERDALCLS